jgi:PII-like signaling protein
MRIISGDALRLRIYTGERDTHKGRSLHEVILESARREGLAGGTVFRGLAGFGANSVVHTARVLRLSEDLPVVVEIIDDAAKIEAFLPRVEALLAEGLVTVDPVRVLLYRHGPGKDTPKDTPGEPAPHGSGRQGI